MLPVVAVRLYDGVSVDGTSYKPDTVQKVHQSYGRDYQLPNFSAHNETCANIGNVLMELADVFVDR
jgi:uncharacterized protein